MLSIIAKEQDNPKQQQPVAEAAQAEAVLGPSFLERLGKFISELLVSIGQLWERMSQRRVEKIRIKAQAKVVTFAAQAAYKKTAAEADTAKWQSIFQTLGRQFRQTLRRWAEYRKQFLARKIVHERAKTQKWQEIQNAVGKFFTALREEIRSVVDWMSEYCKTRPERFRKFVGTISWSVCYVLAGIFAVVTFYGIATDNYWIWTLSPLGVLLSLTVYPLISSKGFFANIGRMAVTCCTIMWAGSWLIFRFG